jgi:hypothetical protein
MSTLSEQFPPEISPFTMAKKGMKKTNDKKFRNEQQNYAIETKIHRNPRTLIR